MAHKTMPPPHLGRHIVSGAVWITLEAALLQVLSLLVFALLARLLSLYEFGLASIAFALVSSCKIVLVDSIASIVARKAAGTALEYTTAFWLSVLMSVLAFLALQALSFAADGWFHTEGLGAVLRIMSLLLLAQGLARTQEVWMARHFHYRALALRSLVGAVAGGVVGVGCAFAGLGAGALAFQQVTTSGVGFLLLWAACPWRPSVAFSLQASREIAAYFVSTSGSSLAYAFSYGADTVLIGAFFGPSSAGIYNVAKRLRFAVQSIVSSSINGVAASILAEVQDDVARFVRVVLTITIVVAAVCGPVFLGGLVVSRDLIVLVFGAQWAGAAPLFQWLAVGGLCAVMLDTHNAIFLIRGRPHWTLYLALLNIGLTFAGFFALSRLRPDLVAAPFVLPYLAVLPISVALMLRVTGLSWQRWLRGAVGPLLATGLMVAALFVFMPFVADFALAPRLIAAIGFGAVIYGAAATLLLRQTLSGFIQMAAARRRSPG